MPSFSAYAAAKTAVVRLTETLAEELRPDHIDVNAIAPGVLKTQMMDQVLQAGPEKVGAKYFAEMQKHNATGGVPPERAAALCVYLGSAAADGISGRLISAQWDPWEKLERFKDDLAASDIYMLRRIVPEDRAKKWN
jgi:NAD(P)-dependent dehydrogenase (short-subunit alcohol dehydrogenase family)